jgi:hypothetical protein
MVQFAVLELMKRPEESIRELIAQVSRNQLHNPFQNLTGFKILKGPDLHRAFGPAEDYVTTGPACRRSHFFYLSMPEIQTGHPDSSPLYKQNDPEYGSFE